MASALIKIQLKPDSSERMVSSGTSLQYTEKTCLKMMMIMIMIIRECRRRCRDG